MAQYRNPYANFYTDKTGSYMSIGGIVPVLVDSYSTDTGGSNTGEGSAGETMHYAYRNFMYCDGAQYEIKDYPLLYEKIGNNYVTLTSERIQNNAIRSSVSGDPGTVYRTFVDGSNVFVEIYAQPIAGTNSYERVIPNNASLTFDALGDYPTANGQVNEAKAYRLEYSDSYQSSAAIVGTHVYRMLLNYDPSNLGGGGGTPGGTVSWNLTSTSLINTNAGPILPLVNYGTIPAVDPGTFDPLTGTGYPTGYTQYPTADNDTIAISWANLSGMPTGFSVDTYELVLEDLSITEFKHWHIQNIPSTVNGLTVNQAIPAGATLLQNSVEATSLGSAPDWVNNGYSGPQPPSGEKHTYRLHVKAILTDAQELVTHIDFTAGSGGLIPNFNRPPIFTDNFVVTGDDDGVVGTDLNVVIGNLANQPTIKIRKAFDMRDLPYVIGKFRVPDYRERKLIGYGEGVNGSGTPLVGDAVTIKVGDTGGQWYIGTDVIEDPAEFYQISDVLTTGYGDVETLVQPFLIGEKKYTVGPIQDYIFARPSVHSHQLLHSEPDDATFANVPGADVFTTGYNRIRGYINNFIPNGLSETKGHSHGLLGYRPLSPRTATYGNVDGIGLREPTNAVDDTLVDVNDASLTWNLSGTAFINWGTGFGEGGGFASPGSGTQYLAFGTPGSITFNTFQATRQAALTIAAQDYSTFYVLAKGGNDSNGGERVNDSGDNLRIRFRSPNVNGNSPTAWEELMESAGTYNTNNGTTGFAAYDNSYAVWKNREVTIPTAYRTAAAQPITIEMIQTPDTKVVAGSDPRGEYIGAGNSTENLTGIAGDPPGANFAPNGHDTFGIAKIGLRNGSGGAWDGCYNYKITEAGAIPFSTASADGSQITVVFPGTHNFAIGNNVVISNASGGLNGTYEIITDGFSASSFKANTTKNGSSSAGTVRLASGYFQEFPVTPTPKVWVVDNNTSIGGKEIIVIEPGVGELRIDETIDSGTANIAASEGGDNITSYIIEMAGGGGGGAGSTGNGGNGGTTSVTLTVDGTPYTITANGGNGGTSGNGGGAGGSGGQYSIPAALFADPRFSFETSVNGAGGTSGGSANGASPAGGGGNVFGDRGVGGNGGFNTFTTNGSYSTSSSNNGSFNTSSVPGMPAGGTVTSVSFDISGGAGGNGPPNGQAGCSTVGGTGSPGRRVTGVISGSPGNIEWIIGRKGGQGVNQQSGSVGEPAAAGGGGAANGGGSGTGAWGNGGSGGGGGGATRLSINTGNVAGAGGGGGGGGTGGGDNNGSAPGGTVDPCWTGGSGLGPSSGLFVGNPIAFNGGGQGGSKGCTSGGGGGGGGGCGPSGGGGGGAGGAAGAGHVNTGSGSGGNAGRSAVNSALVTSYSESNGSTGDGYVSLTVNYQSTGNNPSGGGGGAGAGLTISIQPQTTDDDITTAFAVSVGGGGNGGSGGGNNGSGGRVNIRCFGQLPGEDNVVGITDPGGRYWDVPGFPQTGYIISGNPTNSDIWHSASDGVNVVGSTGDNFPLASNITNSLSNRNIRFSGSGSRFLQIGPLNLTNADQITMGIIKGNGSNGGDTPEEALVVYFKTSLESTSETPLQAIAQPGNISASGWVNYSIPLDEESAARANGVYLVVRQTRPAASGDNDDPSEGDSNDNWGIGLFGLRYATFIDRVFVPTLNATLPGNEGTCGPDDGVNEVRRVVSAGASNIRFTDGTLNLSTSTPVSVLGTARVQETLPLVTKYHRAKYLIKAL